MTATKTLVAKWNDEFGGTFDRAYIKIRDFDVFSHNKFRSDEEDTHYANKNSIEGLSYVGNFWYDESKQIAGKKSRPLRVEEDDGSFTSEIVVDLERFEFVQILNGDLETNEKALALIAADIERRSK